MDLLIKGYLCDPAAGWEKKAKIFIRKGQVEAIFPTESPDISDVPVIDLGHHLVLPGLVDMHVHFREPGGEHKETLASGAAAAVAGGFTSIACMPNTFPPLDNAEKIRYIIKKARQIDLAKVYPVGAISVGQEGEKLSDLEAMAKAGAVAFSDDGCPVLDSSLMVAALKQALELDCPVIAHCEDVSLSAGGAVYHGEVGTRLGLPMVSKAAEPSMVARDIVLQNNTGGLLHLAHLSTRESVELLRWAKEMGRNVTAEVTPHHLCLTEKAVETHAADAKMNPPLGSEDDRQALVDALCRGVVDIVATDHAPHHPDEKTGNLVEAPFGVVGLETAFPLLYTFLVEPGLMSLGDLVFAMSVNPARRLKISGGTLAPGAPADLVVIDTQKEWVVDKSAFYSQGKNTPFQDWKLRGIPVMTIVNGDIKMINGRVKGVGEDFPGLKGASNWCT